MTREALVVNFSNKDYYWLDGVGGIRREVTASSYLIFTNRYLILCAYIREIFIPMIDIIISVGWHALLS